MDFLIVISIIAALLIVIGIGVFLVFNRNLKEADETGRYPEGHWMGVGIGFGLLLGMPLGFFMGIATDNIAVGIAMGPALGMAIGVAIGSALEKKHRENVRPLTEEEIRMKKRLALVTLKLLIIGLLIFLALVFQNR